MFLEKLDYLIQQKGINKHVLAIESGIPYTTIDGFYKKGYENTKLSTLMKLCAYFNVSLDYLAQDDTKITPSDEESKERDASEKELMSWIETLDTVKIKRLLDILYLIELPDSDYEKISEIIRLFLGKDKQS